MKLCKIVLLSSILFSAVLFSCTKKAPESVQKNNASRIVSLTPAGSEILCAIGAFDQMVARTDFCDYPEQVKSLPSTGGFDGKTLSIETILSYNPDFVYAAKGMHDQFLPLLQQQNITCYLSTADSVQGVLSEIIEIGRITGHSDSAEKLIAAIKKDLSEVKKTYSGTQAATVYWEIWNPPFMSVGGPSFINDLLDYANCKNIFAQVNEAYPVVSEEAILAANPDVIIVPDYNPDNLQAVKNRPNWQNLSAVKNDRIYALNADLISRPGPRIAQSAALIAKAVYQQEK